MLVGVVGLSLVGGRRRKTAARLYKIVLYYSVLVVVSECRVCVCVLAEKIE